MCTLHRCLSFYDFSLRSSSDVFYLLPPDPTLTVDNVSRVMEKVEPKQRLQVLECITGYSNVTAAIKSKFSDISEREAAYVDIYVNCKGFNSWEEIASSLFKYGQVAAVDEVKSYLPPKGEPCLCSVCICCTRHFNSHIIIMAIY